MGPGDAQLLFELDQDADVMLHINHGKVPTFKDIKEIFIPRMESYTNKTVGWGLWKLTDRLTKTYIGWVLIRPMDLPPKLPSIFNKL